MTSSDESFANERGKGRSANAPVHIPLRGWRDIIWRLYSNFNDSRILLTAAGVTFYLLLSLVPTLTAFVSLYGLFNDRASVLNQVQLLVGIVPPGALEVLQDQLTRLVGEKNTTLGWTFLVALAIALWSASAGVKALFEAMNIAYHEREERSFITQPDRPCLHARRCCRCRTCPDRGCVHARLRGHPARRKRGMGCPHRQLCRHAGRYFSSDCRALPLGPES
ncbi:YihY/virulence factor BrkB family protein [Devosia chinhatensis]|uniref:YihY/virulence factor BrkB family protein n=1 Tax=Devosia aurantiaca TaxID=2714858 RepID=A0A6M1SUY0_9HYPH|nr:YihY/virulence factor BrkB family protein [Devosia aurantiaca]